MDKFPYRARHAGLPRCWVYGYFVVEKGSNYIINDEGRFPVIVGTENKFTGLIAKHNRRVYECDIIVFDNRDIGGEIVIGEVIFNTDLTLGNLEFGLWTKNGYYRTDFLGEISIMGNTFEKSLDEILKEME